MVNFYDCESRIGESEIRSVELLLGLRFPEQYRRHMMINNGGRCEPSEFSFIEDGRVSNSQIDWFHAIYDGEIDNLISVIKILKMDKKRVPTQIVPIAHDPGGNLICISCDGPDHGAIYFWDHEKEVDYSVSDDFDYSNLYFIAADFDGFLSGLV